MPYTYYTTYITQSYVEQYTEPISNLQITPTSHFKVHQGCPTNKQHTPDTASHLPTASTQPWPLLTRCFAIIRAVDPAEQWLFTLNTGTPVRPSSGRGVQSI